MFRVLVYGCARSFIESHKRVLPKAFQGFCRVTYCLRFPGTPIALHLAIDVKLVGRGEYDYDFMRIFQPKGLRVSVER